MIYLEKTLKPSKIHITKIVKQKSVKTLIFT